MVYPERKQPFESLTQIDERIDFIHGQMAQVQLAIDKLLAREGMEPMDTITRNVSLSLTLLPLTGNRIHKPSPLEGRIVQIIPHWPDGCNALVDMAIGHGEAVWMYPSETDTYVALNDATPVLVMSEAIRKGERLWMNGRNGDAVNSHAINCTFVIVGVK